MLSSLLTCDQLKPGPLSNTCSLGLVEGLFFEDRILKLSMHKFELKGSKTLLVVNIAIGGEVIIVG